MDKTTVFTKTAKGITQVNQRSASLSKDLMKILKLVDGKSTFAQIMEKGEVDKPVLEKAMNTLIRDGFARIFETKKEPDPFGEDDFDFTAPGKLPGSTQRVVAAAALDISELARQQEKAEADRKARENAQVAARDKAREAADRAKAEREAKMREEEARRQAAAAHAAKLAAEQKAKDEEEARNLAALRAKAQAEADARARAALEAKVKEEELRKRLMTEQLARAAAEQKVAEEAEAQRLAEARAKAEAEARALAEARSRAEAEAQALAKARAEAEVAARKQAQEAVAQQAQRLAVS